MATIAPLLLAAGALFLFTRSRKEEVVEDSEPTGTAADQLPAVDPAKDLVVFSEDGSKYAISAGWRIRVLDEWLASEFEKCQIVTKYTETLAEDWQRDPNDFYGDGALGQDILSVAWAGSFYALIKFLPVGKLVSAAILTAEFALDSWSGALALSPFHKEAIASTGAGAAARFMKSHTVQVGQDPAVKIVDLPPENENVQELAQLIMDYVTNFQSREFTPNDADKSCKS